MRNFVNILNERGNVKMFNSAVEVPKEDLEKIIDLAQKTPSGWNLQHWKFIVFESETSREKLFPVANYQKSVLDAGAVVAVMADTQADKNFDYVYNPLLGDSLEEWIRDRLREQVSLSYDDEENGINNAFEHAFTNAGMSAVTLAYAAESYGYDTGIIGGFNKEEFINEFDVPERYIPLVLIPIGRKSEMPHKSTRFSRDNTTTWI